MAGDVGEVGRCVYYWMDGWMNVSRCMEQERRLMYEWMNG